MVLFQFIMFRKIFLDINQMYKRNIVTKKNIVTNKKINYNDDEILFEYFNFLSI